MSEKSKEDLLRQEGREEVLEWLRERELISYSKPENLYFIYNRFTEHIVLLPWNREE